MTYKLFVLVGGDVADGGQDATFQRSKKRKIAPFLAAVLPKAVRETQRTSTGRIRVIRRRRGAEAARTAAHDEVCSR